MKKTFLTGRDHGNPEAYKQAFKSDQIYKRFESLVNYH